MYACPNSCTHSDTSQPAITNVKTPTYASGDLDAPASQANAPPSALTAQIARKTGLGRTDCRTGRMFTTRKYLSSTFCRGRASGGLRNVRFDAQPAQRAQARNYPTSNQPLMFR